MEIEAASVTLNLSAFIGSRVDDIENENGDLEKCVVIPLDRNGIEESNNGNVYVNAWIRRARNSNKHGWTHYLRMKVNPFLIDKLEKMGFSVPLLGFLRRNETMEKCTRVDNEWGNNKRVKRNHYE